MPKDEFCNYICPFLQVELGINLRGFSTSDWLMWWMRTKLIFMRLCLNLLISKSILQTYLSAICINLQLNLGKLPSMLSKFHLGINLHGFSTSDWLMWWMRTKIIFMRLCLNLLISKSILQTYLSAICINLQLNLGKLPSMLSKFHFAVEHPHLSY